jgi:hypothetical protein
VKDGLKLDGCGIRPHISVYVEVTYNEKLVFGKVFLGPRPLRRLPASDTPRGWTFARASREMQELGLLRVIKGVSLNLELTTPALEYLYESITYVQESTSDVWVAMLLVAIFLLVARFRAVFTFWALVLIGSVLLSRSLVYISSSNSKMLLSSSTNTRISAATGGVPPICSFTRDKSSFSHVISLLIGLYDIFFSKKSPTKMVKSAVCGRNASPYRSHDAKGFWKSG